MTVAGYYRSNFVNSETFTRRPRYHFDIKVNVQSFTRRWLTLVIGYGNLVDHDYSKCQRSNQVHA